MENSKSKTERLAAIGVQGVVVAGLVWLGHTFYPNEKWNWLVVIATILAFQFWILPTVEEWLKNTVKQAMREKQIEDDEYAQKQAVKE